MTALTADQLRTYDPPSFTDEEANAIVEIELQSGHVNRAMKTHTGMSTAMLGRAKSLIEPIITERFPDYSDTQSDKVCTRAVRHAVAVIEAKRDETAKSKGLRRINVIESSLAESVALMETIGGEIPEVPQEGISKALTDWPEEFNEDERAKLIQHLSRYIISVWTAKKVLHEDRKALGKLITSTRWWQAMCDRYGDGTKCPGITPEQAGRIIGSIRNPSDYPTMDRIFKRMGMGCFNGSRQGYQDGRRVTGEDAIAHGYSTTRRTIMHLSGEANIKQRNRWRDIYDRFKAEIREKHPEPEDIGRKTKEGKVWMQFTDIHVHLLAKRKMEKEILKAMVSTWWATYGRCSNPHVTQAA